MSTSRPDPEIAMPVSRKVRDQLKLDSEQFTALFEDELRPNPTLTGLKLLRDKAHNEERLREAYQDRALYELLQNARDAGATRVACVLSPHGLAFLHDGRWFTVANLRSLVDGWSDKKPDECIGHKGLGFRSVLEITPSPHLIQVQHDDFFGVRFSWSQNNNFIRAAIRKDPSLKEHYDDWTGKGRNVCPVLYLPALAKKGQLKSGADIYDGAVRGDFGGRWTTFFWLPAHDESLDQAVRTGLGTASLIADSAGRERLIRFLEIEAAVVLPYLAPLQHVAAYAEEELIGSTGQPAEEQRSSEQATVRVMVGNSLSEQVFFRMEFTYPIPPAIQDDPATPHAVRSLKEARIVLSMRLSNGRPSADPDARFHVFFPTEEKTGFGFSIHGDFHVQPNRTHLMSGRYNEWLIERAAEAAAGPFLGRLLEVHPTLSTFESLRPLSEPSTKAAKLFREGFASSLKARREPFLPTRERGWKGSEEVVMPPRPDRGFWHDHFSEVLADVTGYDALISPEADSAEARKFYQFAGVETLKAHVFLELMETRGERGVDSYWWYECYEALADDQTLSRLSPDEFLGRRLVPTEDGVVPISTADDRVVVFPPPSTEHHLHVPRGFHHAFDFLEPTVAERLRAGRADVTDWIRGRFRVSAFEATDLLPKAVRSSVGALFRGEIQVSRAELIELWSFVVAVQGKRPIESTEFWQEIGRLPVPLHVRSASEIEDPAAWAPAFFTFWPDGIGMDSDSCHGVPDLPRMDRDFFDGLAAASERSNLELREFFRRAGVRGHPQILRYSRVVASGEDVPLQPDALLPRWAEAYTGDRQRDENRTVLRILAADGRWNQVLAGVQRCSHDVKQVLHRLSAFHGLNQVVEWAQMEAGENADLGAARLWRLVRALSSVVIADAQDQGYCHAGPGGHILSGGSYLLSQLDQLPWLPSTLGPTRRREAFVRHQHQRLVSLGREEEELGDLLFPYVVAEDSATQAQLERLELQLLDTTDATTNSARLRALWMLGERLSSEWGREFVLATRGRWRRVRSAIQELYQALNQTGSGIRLRAGTRLAARQGGKTDFVDAPYYYADPGSVVERAFKDDLWLIDVDRRFPALFDAIGVVDLADGSSVEEHLLHELDAFPAKQLAEEIIDGLAPYLLAPLQARTGEPLDGILRRLRERFEVFALPELEVEFRLAEPPINRRVPTPHFYLRRRVLPGSGAIKENHYTLFVRGAADCRIADVDADALGSVLAQVMLQTEHVGIGALFPRITAKYKEFGHDRERLREFLNVQLSVSVEAQEAAHAQVTGEDVHQEPQPLPPPPPPLVFHRPTQQPSTSTAGDSTRNQVKQWIEAGGEKLIRSLFPESGSPTDQNTGNGGAGASARRSTVRVTPEQETRGRRGEDEILRRLRQEEGWSGFTFLSDCRELDVGYDFLAKKEGREVKLEVKTFLPHGRVVMTQGELREAARACDDYYLIGIVDDGGAPQVWAAHALRNPFHDLLNRGQLEQQVSLLVSAADLFPSVSGTW